MLTIEQFDRTRRLALQLAGIELHERHRDLLYRRCCRTQMEPPAAFDALLDAAENRDPAASRRLVTLVTTNHTAFFRHPWHFDVAAEHALWAAHRRGTARLWCAAAATGQEPYSLGMALIEVFRREDPPATILATDIDEDALAVAHRGEYGSQTVAHLPEERHAQFLGETVPAGQSIAACVRRLVEFRPLNLVDAVWHVPGPFDVIFCRNVLMYLEAAHRRTVLDRMASLLVPDGLLLLDPAEHMKEAGNHFLHQGEGIYQRCRSISGPAHPARLRITPNRNR